ncbi:histidine kinase [Polaribacter litorisediminis]|uniref:sensor histidine kinase n=1 Tax=Polaribacter litorisediminis TaxID=1908341 RepID=UPI001CC053FC|nr:histidine kinase [Polaribacter litorisediminis]UAM98879.1 histidine kinase [Polaribacter litorisediminis]
MKKFIEPIIHIFLWAIGYFLILNYTSTIGDFRKDQGPYWVAIGFGTIINQIIFYGTAFYLVPKFLRLKKIKLLVLSVLGGFIFINFLESSIDFSYLASFFSSENESFTVHLIYNAVISFFILLVALSYSLIKYWIHNEKLKRVLLEEKLSTEMAFLKSKINPHFLFNVLNSFYAKSLKHNVPELADGIAKLAELMRYMVYETNSDKVSLEKEIHHLKNFIQVYQLRIAEEDEVYINFDIQGEVSTPKISPMLLIPFVENAIKHGIDPKSKSIIDISLKVTHNRLTFKVGNTIRQGTYGLNDESSGFGLDNLKKRLSILYPKAYTLETKEEKGYFISLLNLQLD